MGCKEQVHCEQAIAMHKVLKCLTVKHSANTTNPEGTSFLLVKENAKSTACSIYYHTTSTNSKKFWFPTLCGYIAIVIVTSLVNTRLPPGNTYIFRDVAQLKLFQILESMSFALLT